MPEQRKLAAIMLSDIVGYSRFMSEDEEFAFQLHKKNRQLQQSLISKYNGEWLKEMGDGILAQFGSATDSVRCAIEIQGKARKELGAQLRIGIHLGDVTFEHNDVFGDGVNIASRLQSIADPGGIFISEPIQNSIRSKSDILTKYLVQANLKNVSYPIKVYAIQNEGFPKASADMLKKRLEKARGRNIYRSPILWTTVLIATLRIRNHFSNCVGIVAYMGVTYNSEPPYYRLVSRFYVGRFFLASRCNYYRKCQQKTSYTVHINNQ